MSYTRFGLMILVSTLVMYVLMYLNTYGVAHVAWSQTRGWMALLMGGVMAIIMMTFMWGMYERKALNWGIVAGAFVVAAGSLWFVRSQATVDDVAYMKAMIPHHSIAVLTSSEANIRDPRVRRLADQIIEAQMQEIAEMRALIADLQARPPAADAPNLAPLDANAVPVEEAVAQALEAPATP
jgi:Na+/proline symporter